LSAFDLPTAHTITRPGAIGDALDERIGCNA
jgi:hypothetical protein